MATQDGHITLGVKIDSSGINKGTHSIKNVLNSVSNYAQKTGIAIQQSTNRIKEQQYAVQNLKNGIKAQEQALKELNTEYAKYIATGKGDTAKAQQLQAQIKELNAELNDMKQALASISGTKQQKRINKVGKGFQVLSSRITGIAKSALIFSTIYRALQLMVSVLKDVAMGDKEFRDSLNQLKAALWVAFTPILNIIVPALKIMVNWLTRAAIAVGKFFAAISGKSYSTLMKNAMGLKAQADGYKNIGKSAKNAKKQLAGFDDIDILSRDSSGSGSAMGNIFGNMDYNTTFGTIGMITGMALVGLGIIMLFSGHPFVGISMIASGWAITEDAVSASANLGEEEKTKLAKIGAITGTALIGIGVLLLLSPLHWKYGLAMIATGAMAVYKAYTLGEFSQDIKTLVSKIVLISGVVAFTLGIIFLLVNKAGMWEYGLGLMVLGVVEVVTAYTLGGDELKAELQSFALNYWKELYAIGALMVIAGIVLLFINAKLTWKYALTLIVAGIATVATTTVLGGDELKAELQSFVVQYWEIIYGISALIAIVGIVLLFCKQWKYGITLLAAGIVAIVSTTLLGGDELKQELKTFAINYWDVIYGISALIVIVGVILLFVPGCIGVGLTMIAAGIGTLVTTTVLGGSELKQELVNTVTPFKDEIVQIGALMFAVGLILLFTPGLWGVGLTLLGIGAASLYGASKLDSSELSSQLTTELDKVNASAQSGVNKINNTLSGIDTPSGWSLDGAKFTLPKNGYARGTVVPPNKPHLAWFGDNTKEPEIVSPVSTMKQAFSEAMLEIGMTGQPTKEEHWYVGETEIMSLIYRLAKGGERIKGNSLITGGVY